MSRRRRRLELTGRTALVTGASAGIGEAIAHVLARDVGTLVLVARREERLVELARRLESERAKRGGPPLQVVPRAADLADRAALASLVDGLEAEALVVDVLVNNAGFGHRDALHRSDPARLAEMLEVNVCAATYLVRRLLPAMIARGAGGILNLGSTAGLVPLPDLAVYAATKAYLNHLSESLHVELAGTGVVVTAICPGPVATEFQEVAGTADYPSMPPPFWVSVAQCAEESVAALKQGRARLVPGGAMRAAIGALDLVPPLVARPLLRRGARRSRR